MQAIKNGLKSILRTPGKTLLFSLILTLVSALLTVSCCTFGTVRRYLDDCDEYFHTIAELRYIGRDYPSSVVYDEELAAAVEANQDRLRLLLSSEAVRDWTPFSAELAHSPLIHRHDVYTPRPDAAVLRIRVYTFDDNQSLYVAAVTEAVYAEADCVDDLIQFRLPNGTTLPECPGDYLVVGSFYQGNSGVLAFQTELVSYDDDGESVELPSILPAGSDAEAEARILRYAEDLRWINDACRATYTNAIEDLYFFQQQMLTLTDGRFFTQSEYDRSAKVCVVSEQVSRLLDVQVGDRIPFTVFHAAGDLYQISNLTQIDEGDYEIVGIVSYHESYPFCVFLPQARAAQAIQAVNGYTLGQFRLENDGVSSFLSSAAPLLRQGFRLDVYDQGYAAATEPIEELLFISVIFLAVCLLLAVCALALQSHLFISRQQETARTMLAMGSGRAHVCVYFLSAALSVFLVGSVLGILIGTQAERLVTDVLTRFASQFEGQDVRFSATRLAVSRTLAFNPGFSARDYAAAVGILAGGSLLFTLLFTLKCLHRKESSTRKKSAAPRLPKRNAHVSRLSGFFKYGLLSLRRCVSRTVAVLLLGLAAALFFGQLNASMSGYRDQLAAFRENAVITGCATDPYGRDNNGLMLYSRPIARMCESELLQDYSITTRLGHVKILGAVGKEQIPYVIPYFDTFPYENAFYLLSKEAVWTGTSSILRSPQLSGSQGASVEWLDGWSEADFIRLEEQTGAYDRIAREHNNACSYRGGPAVCALSSGMMEEYGVALGDEIDTVVAFSFNNKDPHLTDYVCPMRLRVVASYTSSAGIDVVFSPLTLVRPGLENELFFREYPPGSEFDRMQSFGLSDRLNYSSFLFTLKDSARLDELRTELEEAGFTWVHSADRVKSCAFIDDEIYLNTTHSMERQIQFIGVLYHALYLFAGIIGFALAWLLIQSRRREIAVMRALGTQPGRIIGNFLLEQLLLMAIGLGLGVWLGLLAGTAPARTQLWLTAAFWGVWTLSTLICLIVGLRKQSFAALTEPE